VDDVVGLEVEGVGDRDRPEIDRALRARRVVESTAGCAPATPEPMRGLVPAALTSASADWDAMSPWTTVNSMAGGSAAEPKSLSTDG
jgi:hypothetical protein